jgi:hypothetical protein
LGFIQAIFLLSLSFFLITFAAFLLRQPLPSSSELNFFKLSSEIQSSSHSADHGHSMIEDDEYGSFFHEEVNPKAVDPSAVLHRVLGQPQFLPCVMVCIF